MLGIAGDDARDVTFVEDLGDLLEEVVDDLYVRRFHRDEAPAFDRAQALAIARAAVAAPTAPIEPRRASDDGTPAMRRRLACAVRDELEARKRRAGLMSYDDLLTGSTTRCPGRAARRGAAAGALEGRLVDESGHRPGQWDIMRRAFGGGALDAGADRRSEAGGPAFRGARPHTWRCRPAGLRRRCRSTGGPTGADRRLRRPFCGRGSGTGIVYRRAGGIPVARLSGAGAPLQLRRLARRRAGSTPQGFAQRRGARHIARSARDLVGAAGRRPAAGLPRRRRRLVRTHRTATGAGTPTPPASRRRSAAPQRSVASCGRVAAL
jgi:exodeoxyribonuclease V beta subunit